MTAYKYFSVTSVLFFGFINLTSTQAFAREQNNPSIEASPLEEQMKEQSALDLVLRPDETKSKGEASEEDKDGAPTKKN